MDEKLEQKKLDPISTPAPTAEATAETADTATAELPESSWRKVFRSLWWKLHWLAPNTISGPYGSDTTYRKRRAREANISTRVPASEQVRTVAIWGMELFGPSEIDRLYTALDRLAWRRRFAADESCVTDWVRSQRSYGQGGSWLNVGLIIRPGARRSFVNDANFAPLPDEFEYASVVMKQVSASLTCVQVCFVVRESEGRAYERELNTDRGHLNRRTRGSWSISMLGPEHLKQEAVEKSRNQYKHLISSWFAENLPGFFASRKRIDRFPIAELLTTQESFLFAEREPSTSSSTSFFTWKRLIANVSRFDVWTCKALPALQLSLQSQSRSDDAYYTAAVHVPSIPDEDWKFRGHKDIGGIVSICRDPLDGIFRHLAVIEYLKEAESDLKLTRDSMNFSKLKSQRAMRAIQRIQHFFDSSVGLPAIANELVRQSASKYAFRHDCESFTAPGFDRDGANFRDITEELHGMTAFLSQQLLEREAATREHLEQLSTVISVRESVRAQRRMEWLTLLALLVAAASLAVAVPDKWIEAFRTTFLGFLFL